MAQILKGELVFSSISAVLESAETLIAQENMDVSGVNHCDSAGIALLLELHRRAKVKGRTLKITGANQQLQQLIHFYALNGILGAA